MPRQRKVTFEKVSEDENGITWHVEAIHATTTRNKRKYSKEELVLAARSLSYRPININHDEKRWLEFDFTNPVSPNSNCSLVMEWDEAKKGVSGDYWITDKAINERIEKGEIATVSIEQVPSKGEACSCMVNDCTCEQLGIIFTGTGFLETFKGVQPGDPEAGKFTKKEAAVKCSECDMEFETQEMMDDHMKDKHEKKEATIDQITNAVLDDVAKKIQAQYDLVNALQMKFDLTPYDDLRNQLVVAKSDLFWMVMDYLNIKQDESTKNEQLPKERECDCPVEKTLGKEMKEELLKAGVPIDEIKAAVQFLQSETLS